MRCKKESTIMTIQYAKNGMAAVAAVFPTNPSSFVRRLIAAQDDPAKQRIRDWLREVDDERLKGFGLTPEDIAILRGTRAQLRG
jgi:hypothetical protein